jgi:ribosome biogenesis GTPase
MSGKKTARKQSWKRNKVESERDVRQQRSSQRADDLVNSSELGPEQTGRVVAHYGTNFDVTDPQGHIQQCLVRRNIERLVCGDEVIWQRCGEDLGVITQLLPRRSLLTRPSFNNQLKPVAANIDQIMVVVAPQPDLDEELIDRYLVAARLTEINPVIVVNKIDLLDTKALDVLRERLKPYADIGYELVYASVYQQHGLADLTAHLRDKTSIFAGQSGVGKSSLIQTLLPHEELRVGELSQSSGLGKHTTTVSVLYSLPTGGYLIDSPGVRAFGLGHVSQSRIALGYEEFHAFLGQCKYHNCTHLIEPHCAIKNAVERGEINPQRYQRYRRIVQSLASQK